MSALRSRLRRSARNVLGPRRDDSGVAMILALLVIATLATSSIAVAGLTLSRFRPTLLDRKLVQAEGAADAGFDAALNRIRASGGTWSKLPCGPLTGYVDASTTGSSQFSVTIQYFSTDPTSQLGSPTWLAANDLSCTSGVGPGNGAPNAVRPKYVVLTSTGSNSSKTGSASATNGNRVLQTEYHLTAPTNVNIPGGNIAFVSSPWQNLCLESVDSSGNDSVASGSAIAVNTCGTSPGFEWAYTSNLQLEAVASNPAMCMSATQTSGTPVKLAACSTASLPSTTSTQVWGRNDNGQFQSSNTTDTGLLSLCFDEYAGTQTGVAVTPAVTTPREHIDIVNNCSAGDGEFAPSSTVGAGAAGVAPRTDQLVNYAAFGDCLDITNVQVGSVWEIAYPCKQDPNAANRTWNEVFDTLNGINNTTSVSPATGSGTQICSPSLTVSCQYVNEVSAGNNYCLTAPTTPSGTAATYLVIVTQCSSTSKAQRWHYTSSNGGSYDDAYQIVSDINATSVGSVDSGGKCLTLEQPTPGVPPGVTFTDGYHNTQPDPPNYPYGYIDLQPCSSSLYQKWNAPPNIGTASQTNTFELPHS